MPPCANVSLLVLYFIFFKQGITSQTKTIDKQFSRWQIGAVSSSELVSVTVMHILYPPLEIRCTLSCVGISLLKQASSSSYSSVFWPLL